MTFYQNLQNQLKLDFKTWLVTGVAGFIGSNLLEQLLKLDQNVIGLDNFSTGFKHNLDSVKRVVNDQQWSRFKFIEGDIRNLSDCQKVCTRVDYVLHQAALGSVPRSVADPIATNQSNIDGFLNMLVAARDAQVNSFTYAASSSTYGDHPDLPKIEERIGNPLSPYAVTKYVNELYARVFALSYDFKTIGLRYFNVFGRRQNTKGSYAAVIPKWILALMHNQPLYINGNGLTSRDFCYIDNAVQANLLAATIQDPEANNQVYNIAVGHRTTLNDLYTMLQSNLKLHLNHLEKFEPTYCAFRPGDVQHSQADITKAQRLLKYQPTHTVDEGLVHTVNWFIKSSI